MKIFTFFILFLSNIAMAAWPEHPITIIVPYPAGGLTDRMARVMQPELSDRLNVPVNVINVPGAVNSLAINKMLESSDPNYTFMLTAEDAVTGQIASGSNLHLKIQPVILISKVPLMLVSKDADGAEQFRSLLKTRGKINIGNNGVNGQASIWSSQLSCCLDLNQIPYKGGGPLAIDTIAGQVQFGIMSVSSWAPFIRDKKVYPILVTSKDRLPAYPDVPTFKELKIPGKPIEIWFGAFVDNRANENTVNRLNTVIRQILKSNDNEKPFRESGMEFLNLDPKASRVFIEEQIKLITPMLPKM